MPIRTFLALDLDSFVRDGLTEAQEALARSEDRISWVPWKNLHVTLKFLGDVPDEVLPEVCELMAAVAGEIEPFDLAVQGLRAVPSGGPRKPVRMVWADVVENTGRLEALHAKLDLALTGLRIRQENRPFRPHITLGRVRFVKNIASFRRAAGDWAAEDFGSQLVEEVVAYTSTLTPEGSVYARLAGAELGV